MLCGKDHFGLIYINRSAYHEHIGKNNFYIFEHPGTLTLTAERQSARMSKITNDGITRSDTGCFIAVPTWQQWASMG